MQLFGILFFALTIPLSARSSRNAGRRRTLIWVTVGDRRVRPGDGADVPRRQRSGAVLTMVVGLSLMGLTYGPLGHGAVGALSDVGALHRQLADVQPCRHLRRLAGPVHRDVAGHQTYGLQYVGYYLSAAAGLTLVGLLAIRETKDEQLV